MTKRGPTGVNLQLTAMATEVWRSKIKVIKRSDNLFNISPEGIDLQWRKRCDFVAKNKIITLRNTPEKTNITVW